MKRIFFLAVLFFSVESYSQEWIDCEKQLPEESGNYLVWVVSCNDSFYMENVELVFFTKTTRCFEVSYWKYSVFKNEITHWRQLPEKPKKVKSVTGCK